MSKPTVKKPQPWQVRRLAYGVVAIVVAVLGWIGVLSDIQADQVTGQVDRWLPILLGVLAPALAATKTHAGSDDRATTAEVRALRQAPDAGQIGRAVVAAIRAEERGEHDTAAPAAPVAPATSVAGYYERR
jgi:hypothetical protein